MGDTLPRASQGLADNPLVYRDNTLMYFGDAKKNVLELLGALQAR